MTSSKLSSRRSVARKPPICISPPPPPPTPTPPVPPPASVPHRGYFNWPSTEYYDATLLTTASNADWTWEGPYSPAPDQSFAELNWSTITHQATLFMQLKAYPLYKRAMSNPFTITPSHPPQEITVTDWDWTENMTPAQARGIITF